MQMNMILPVKQGYTRSVLIHHVGGRHHTSISPLESKRAQIRTHLQYVLLPSAVFCISFLLISCKFAAGGCGGVPEGAIHGHRKNSHLFAGLHHPELCCTTERRGGVRGDGRPENRKHHLGHHKRGMLPCRSAVFRDGGIYQHVRFFFSLRLLLLLLLFAVLSLFISSRLSRHSHQNLPLDVSQKLCYFIFAVFMNFRAKSAIYFALGDSTLSSSIFRSGPLLSTVCTDFV